MGSAEDMEMVVAEPESKKISSVAPAGASKFSFSLPSKAAFSGRSKPRPSDDKDKHKQAAQDEDEEKPEFLNEFDPNSQPAAKKLKVIPKLENSWRPEKKMKNIQMTESELQFEPEAEAAGIESQAEYGLNIRRSHNVSDSMEIEQNGKSNEKAFMEKSEQQIVREAVEELPEEASLDAYDSLPVEEFGAALLRGMGWIEGKGIGRGKEVVKPVEYVRRVGREGLGAIPAPPPVEKKHSKSRVLKPGETREEGRRDLVAQPGPDGRVRHVVEVGEKLVERQRKGVAVGKTVRVVDGRHEGLKGEVIEVSDNGDKGSAQMVTVRLSRSEEKVVVGFREVADLGSVEEEDCLRRLKDIAVRGNERSIEGDGRHTRVVKEAEYRNRDENRLNYGSSRVEEKSEVQRKDVGRDEKRGDYRSRDESRADPMSREDRRIRESVSRHQRMPDDGRDEKRDDRRGEDRERQRRELEAQKGLDRGERGYRKVDDGRGEYSYGRNERKSRREDGEEQKESRHQSSKSEKPPSRKEKRVEDDRRKIESEIGGNEKSKSECKVAERNPAMPWLRSHIRVRIISKDFKGGKLYLKKGRVIDVVDPTTCDLLLDENGMVVQGVKQDVLETAIPKRGGAILVVQGKHRGVLGKLMERDSDKGIGVVQKEDTYEMLTLSLDHIAEFVGDPNELGY
jgi:G patch domain/KOW motif-containing protein